jgi:hypothetical protein
VTFSSGARKFLIFLLVILPVGESASARVFNFQDRSFATYLRGTFGTNSLQRNAYAPGMPTTVSFSGANGVSQQYSGEFGVLLIPRPTFALRIGVELLSPAATMGAGGVSSSGTPLFSLDSQVFSVIPQGNLEIFFKKTASARFYAGGGGGYAVTTLKNTYTMTPAGTTALGVQSYIEEASAFGLMGQVFTGFEFSFFDNIGLAFDIGYRYLVVNNYTANRNATTAIGAVTTGGTIKNNDGTNRSTDLSGLIAGIALRIYFN